MNTLQLMYKADYNPAAAWRNWKSDVDFCREDKRYKRDSVASSNVVLLEVTSWLIRLHKKTRLHKVFWHRSFKSLLIGLMMTGIIFSTKIVSKVIGVTKKLTTQQPMELAIHQPEHTCAK